MKLAYFSPLSPQRSGISDYSEQLLRFLVRECEVDVWVHGYEPASPEIRQTCRVVDYSDREQLARLSEYDAIIYNLGNNPGYHAAIYDVLLQYPGVVILHDFVLFYLLAGYCLDVRNSKELFLEEMRYNGGQEGYEEGLRILAGPLPPLQYRTPQNHPLNRRAIEAAKGILVHSEYTKRMVMDVRPDVRCMSIHFARPLESRRVKPIARQIRSKYGLQEGETMLASFGYITPNKRIHQVLYALSELRNDYKFKYFIVGDWDYTRRLVDELQLNEHVILTGYAPRSEFDKLLLSAEVVINLRYPYMGETSAALVRAMAAGKPCLVSDIGWFSELPDDTVIKIKVDAEEIGSIRQALQALMDDSRYRKRLAAKARRYARTAFDGGRIARQIVQFAKDAYKDTNMDAYKDICMGAYKDTRMDAYKDTSTEAYKEEEQ